MAVHSAALLAKENHDLRTANKKEKQKLKRSRRQMTPNARDLTQARTEQDIEAGEHLLICPLKACRLRFSS
jgi:hypothetical protein